MAEKITITEALAELKTLGKRIPKKEEFSLQYIARSEGVRDPLEKSVPGGSPVAITRERQAIADLQKRHVAIRTSIQKSNHVVTITVADMTKTVAEWLTWRKEIAPGLQQFLTKMRMQVVNHRDQAQKRGNAVVSATAISGTEKPTDIVINVDEQALAAEAEQLENILGTLDGALSLKNATTFIELA